MVRQTVWFLRLASFLLLSRRITGALASSKSGIERASSSTSSRDHCHDRERGKQEAKLSNSLNPDADTYDPWKENRIRLEDEREARNQAFSERLSPESKANVLFRQAARDQIEIERQSRLPDADYMREFNDVTYDLLIKGNDRIKKLAKDLQKMVEVYDITFWNQDCLTESSRIGKDKRRAHEEEVNKWMELIDGQKMPHMPLDLNGYAGKLEYTYRRTSEDARLWESIRQDEVERFGSTSNKSYHEYKKAVEATIKAFKDIQRFFYERYKFAQEVLAALKDAPTSADGVKYQNENDHQEIYFTKNR